MRSEPGDFASLYARRARSSKRIFLPRRHALKGLGAAFSVVLLIAATVTGLSWIVTRNITMVTGSAPDSPSREPAPKRPATAGQPVFRKPTPSLPPSPGPTSASPFPVQPPATVTVQPSGPTSLGAAPAPRKPPRAELFTTDADRANANPDLSFDEVWLTNTQPVTGLRLRIRILQTGGVEGREAGAYDQTDPSKVNTPMSDITTSITRKSDVLIYEFALDDGATLPPGRYQLQASYSFKGAANGRYLDGDTYTMTGKDPGTGGVDSTAGDFK